MSVWRWMVKNMDKIKSFDELKALNSKYKMVYDIETSKEKKFVIAVGMATCGVAAGANEVMDKLKEEIISNNITNATVTSTGCLGCCYAEPVVEVRFPGTPSVLYSTVDSARAAFIIKEHIMGGKVLKEAVVERSEVK